MRAAEVHVYTAEEWDALTDAQRAVLAERRRAAVTTLGLTHHRRYHGPEQALELLRALDHPTDPRSRA